MMSAGAIPGSLAARIYRCAHLTGQFELRSGQLSTEYFDKYRFEADPVLLREIAEVLVELLPDEIDALAGLELGGVPLATMVSQLSGIPALFVRKEAKAYGTRQSAEGGPVKGRRIAVIEDVITSGGAVVRACHDLRRQGGVVVVALCVIDREAEGSENLAAEELELRSAFTMTELKAAAAA